MVSLDVKKVFFPIVKFEPIWLFSFGEEANDLQFLFNSCLSTGLLSLTTVIMEDFLRDLKPFKSSFYYSGAGNFALGGVKVNEFRTN